MLETKKSFQELRQDFSLLLPYAQVLEYVKAHPGVTAHKIAEATDAGIHTTRRRLLRLQAENCVRVERYPNVLLFYPVE
jgi:DNA-binding MarR family transcriptional regulator